MSKEAMTRALNVLKTCRSNLFLKDYVEHIDIAIKALEEALAKQEQGNHFDCGTYVGSHIGKEIKNQISGDGSIEYRPSKTKQEQGEPVVGTKTWLEDGKVVTQNLYFSDVYTTPQPAQKPLTDEQIWKFWWNKPEVPEGEDDSMEAQFVAVTRAVLAAHGIKENT